MPEHTPDSTDRGQRPGGIPAEIGGYQVQRVLGSGGMATVYAALQRQPRRTVAIKVMRGAAHTPGALRRFKREIEILGRLRHPYIAQVYAAGVDEHDGPPVPYFVMEYVPGARTIIEFAERRELSLRDRLKLFVKICAAVEHGHRRKIVHRDLKPGNILIDEAGDPKVIDFGVARIVDLDVTTKTAHTQHGELIGTIQYMAPEQLEGARRDLDPSCDVYALGIILYKLVTGRPPHDLLGLPMFTAAQVIREDVPARPGSIRPELRGDVETIILRAMAKDPARRYRSAGSLGRDLVRFLADQPIKARSTGWAHRVRLYVRRHRTEVTAGALVAVVIAIAGAVVLWQRASIRAARDAPAVAAEGPGNAAPGARPDLADPPTGPAPPDAASGLPLLVGADDADPSSSPDDGPVLEAFALTDRGPAVSALVFDPTGAFVAAATDDHTIRWWDVAAGQAVVANADHRGRARGLAFDAAGSRLASTAADDHVVVVERRGDDTRVVLRMPLPGPSAIAISPDGLRLAVCCSDLTVRVLQDDGREIHTLRGTTGAFEAIAFSLDGTRLAAGTVRGDVYVWDATTGRTTHRFAGLPRRVVTIGFTDDGTMVAGMTDRGIGAVWRLDIERDRGVPLTAAVDGRAIGAVAGGVMAVATSEGVALLDLAEGVPVGRIDRPPDHGDLRAMALAPHASWCVLGDADGRIWVAPALTAP